MNIADPSPDAEVAELPVAVDKGFNFVLLRKLVIVTILMFGFGYALVPIYKKICEATGVNILSWDAKMGPDALSKMKNTQIDTSRTVTVEFDANVQGPWRMVPTKNAVRVHPGELITVTYEIANQQARAMTGQAIPSYAPKNSAMHFHKIECFCFSQHTLAANEARQFPVTFVVDSDLPKDIGNITLSFTFFEVAGRNASVKSTDAVPSSQKMGQL